MEMQLRSATLALLICSCSAAAAELSSPSPGQLINTRLSYMKDVAGYKAQHHQPIEDLVQERKVLDKALAEARELGLDDATVQPFIQAQMDVAKAVQYRYRADWLATPEPHWQPRPLDEVRKSIGHYSDAILTQLAAQLKQGATLQAPQKAEFMRDIQQRNVSSQDKELLWRTLSAVTLQRP